jgi:hypothetical protein
VREGGDGEAPMKHAYDDQKSLEGQKFVKEKY